MHRPSFLIALVTILVSSGIATKAQAAPPKPSRPIQLELERVQEDTPLDEIATKEIIASCPAGKKVVGGGYTHFFGGPTVTMRINVPLPDLSGWLVSGTNFDGTAWSVSAVAICAANE